MEIGEPVFPVDDDAGSVHRADQPPARGIKSALHRPTGSGRTTAGSRFARICSSRTTSGASYFPQDFDRATLDPFRILIVSPGSPEKAAATLPAVRAIAEGRPDTWLAVLTPAQAASIWGDVPEIRCVVQWSDRTSGRELTRQIREAARFDAAILFTTDWRPSLAVWRAGIPVRVGVRAGLASMFCTQYPKVEPAADDAALSLQIAHSIGARIPPASF